LKKIIFYFKYKPSLPKPHAFVVSTLQCGLDLNDTVVEINRLLPQLADFIMQFNKLVIESGVNIITDSQGNMSIDIPQSMSDAAANKIINRVGVIDRLITTHGQNINDLFQNGLGIEHKLKSSNTNYVSQLTDQLAQFKKLNASYKH